jgi:hypothetical protein
LSDSPVTVRLPGYPGRFPAGGPVTLSRRGLANHFFLQHKRVDLEGHLVDRPARLEVSEVRLQLRLNLPQSLLHPIGHRGVGQTPLNIRHNCADVLLRLLPALTTA